MDESFTYHFQQFIKNTLERRIRFRPYKDAILAACSGGPDSVVLLDILFHLRDALRFDLRVCHINHGLRGKDADDDEAFVIDLASQYGLSATVRRFSPAEIEMVQTSNLEESARELRYQKLVQAAQDEDCAYIAVGHTRSDQAETVLQRILRSTGLTGLSGIQFIRRDLPTPVIRPLLPAGREQILRYAKENNLSFRLDSMNLDPQYTRVRIRKQLIPLLKKTFNPQIEDALSHLANLAQEDEEFWKTYVDNLRLRIGEATEKTPANRKRFLHLTRAEQTRLLRFYCEAIGVDPSGLQIENAIGLLNGDRPQSEIHFNAKWRLYRRYDEFYFAPPLDLHEIIQQYSIAIPGITRIPDLGVKTETVILPAKMHFIKPQETHTAEFDADKVRRPVVVRTRREGDVIQPLGMDGTKKIKKIFQEKRVPLERRERIPLLCFDEDVAWIAGFCVSETYRIDANTRNVLLVSIHPLE